jgi:hypothetical protein
MKNGPTSKISEIFFFDHRSVFADVSKLMFFFNVVNEKTEASASVISWTSFVYPRMSEHLRVFRNVFSNVYTESERSSNYEEVRI